MRLEQFFPANRKSFITFQSALLAILVILLASATVSSAQAQYKVIYNFQAGNDGAFPNGALLIDATGTLYGTTEFGGSAHSGTVYQLTPTVGGAWTESVLYTFTKGSDGGLPVGNLVRDTAGNLYGVTLQGGDAVCGCGVVYKLSPGQGGVWTETVLFVFAGAAGQTPRAGLTFDASGNLFGTTTEGGDTSTGCLYGSLGCGVVFELSPGNGGTWTETTIHSFVQAEGAGPASRLVFDTAGNLYGTTGSGGNLQTCNGNGCGTAFELMPQGGGFWQLVTLHTFDGRGSFPAGPVFDSVGNLFGVTNAGGVAGCYNCGTAWELSPSTTGWTIKSLHRFDRHGPSALPNPLTLDAAGNIYGTTLDGGPSHYGSIYKLARGASGFTFSLVHAFKGGVGGDIPYAELTIDSNGTFYGTTTQGGSQNAGVVFQLTP